MTHQEILTSLTEKKAQLEHRISAIEADLHQGRSQDFAEQATETENDEVLDEIHHQAKAELKYVIAALNRLKNKKYGFCSSCNTLINIERLHALPYTTTCINCAT
ncbi:MULTISPECIES: TraR/DksA C4-type zinc finger protein [unclassified Colwellia]|jgi:DnaK suppressor protein|uniref:TraR/DksA family transcriptional regulator n=1 Tax=unclassified Colwellia TaxID=196834 RepID=UPI0015F5CBC0|nr:MULTISPECIES: TraR/DksA C4-type zinc finger protein [unclassified Colwellia]MBA6351910.1 TraR/DksA family transcriptional regulator [Colwellia sp. BRX9-1]MBA6355221.1 TraR/DksA family transcriptional regulator [Colwellia sp. BRX8-3]MBA6358853.1 TraR/DksA family transcriptional regulator [Colwellia sp. BRX8-6]MBA6366367.1 TraR/DksA family transcriptional regulator [Colwellia sp. BRX8-5]MBA6374254.1 TraR/DksA family transcriptional regulator [Colwellia sp. BRX8-2]|tara:strand:- start:729 stop:1043 length:315 start_codon:yes stop_codon:yes gene_type:complete